jgi:hypothetical protein
VDKIPEPKIDWGSVIAAVRTPLGLLTLCALIAAPILTAFAWRSEGIGQILLTGGMFLCLCWILGVATIAYWRQLKTDSSNAEIENLGKRVSTLERELTDCKTQLLESNTKLARAQSEIERLKPLRAQVLSVFEGYLSYSASEVFSALAADSDERKAEVRAAIGDLVASGDLRTGTMGWQRTGR